MRLPFVAALLLSGCATTSNGPEKWDFTVAQANYIRDEVVGAPNGMVHCNRIKAFKARQADKTNVWHVSYREYRETGPWKKLSATIRRDGDEWVWLAGDPPKCSITILEG